MSKAFLRESDESHEPQLAAPVSPLPQGAPNYMTASGANRLREDLRRLRLEERPALLQRTEQDPEAKLHLAALDQRIRYLQQSLFSAEVVTVAAGPTDAVRFGTTVIVREPDGTMMQYRLVGVDETDPSRGAISWVSPLAQALMNARVGDQVSVTTPAGQKALTVVAIRYDVD
jgi:transcription elongation factor GreB